MPAPAALCAAAPAAAPTAAAAAPAVASAAAAATAPAAARTPVVTPNKGGGDRHAHHQDWLRKFSIVVLLSLCEGDGQGRWEFGKLRRPAKARTYKDEKDFVADKTITHELKPGTCAAALLTWKSNSSWTHAYFHEKGVRNSMQIALRLTRELTQLELEAIAATLAKIA